MLLNKDEIIYLNAAGLASLSLALSAGAPDGHPEDPAHRRRLDASARRRRRIVLRGGEFNGVGMAK